LVKISQLGGSWKKSVIQIPVYSLVVGVSFPANYVHCDSSRTDMEPQLHNSRLLALVEDIKKAALEECSSSRSASSHYRFLGLIDRLKYTVETPTETVHRLIYQVYSNLCLSNMNLK
jgi:hypothetical protein